MKLCALLRATPPHCVVQEVSLRVGSLSDPAWQGVSTFLVLVLCGLERAPNSLLYRSHVGSILSPGEPARGNCQGLLLWQPIVKQFHTTARWKERNWNSHTSKRVKKRDVAWVL